MADYDRRQTAHRGGYNNRKRRYNEEDDYDRRSQRRRYEEPLHLKLRRQMLAIAESPLKKIDEEIKNIVRTVTTAYDDEEIRNGFVDLVIQLVVEQPLKIPFVAAVVLTSNSKKPELVAIILEKAVTTLNEELRIGAWREVKLVLRFLGCMQGLLDGDGVFPVLEELFLRAVDLQTASSEDVGYFSDVYPDISANTQLESRA
ncbi:MAG: hypothetical protein Q9167_001744 [Letrouitia subvulpina]